MSWTSLLTEGDEWVVRTALACIASDLDRIADDERAMTDDEAPLTSALRESAQRYRETLARIEMADA